MGKKFKQAANEQSTALTDVAISLYAYIQQRAAEVLKPLPIMADAPALSFWQATFQHSKPGEGKHLQHHVVHWPYAERLIYLAREFSNLDMRSQHYIVKAAKAGIWWRGDAIPQFRRIVQAQLTYQRLTPDERVRYRRQLMRTVQQFNP